MSIFALLLSLFFSLSGYPPQHTLSITFSGIKKQQGQLMISIKDHNSEPVKKLIHPVQQLEESVEFILPEGRYAVAAYHDKNSDEKLNRNVAGIPSEPYGFSNNARGTFGPPAFQEQLFTLHQDKSISIALE